MNENSELIKAYHERSKHDLEKGYARGPEYLNWEDQPNSFREYKDSEKLQLPLLENLTIPAKQNKLSLDIIAALLQLSFGLSAWKKYGPDSWSLRCNPSSGNLHPTEVYLIICAIEGVSDGLYHYLPYQHSLELRGSFKAQQSKNPLLMIGLSSIYWREAWKYGERAFRYAQLDTGHAIAALRFSAFSLGLNIQLKQFEHHRIQHLLGLDRVDDFIGAETEDAELFIQINTSVTDVKSSQLPQIDRFYGQANSLGGEPNLNWPIIDKVSHACQLEQQSNEDKLLQQPVKSPPLLEKNLQELILQRRSAQSFIAKQSTIELKEFYAILEAIKHNPAQLPWDCWNKVNVLPVFFVHKVNDLEAGLYLLIRDDDTEQLDILKNAMAQEFIWKKPHNCPEDLKFYQLLSGDIRKTARTLSCYQEIASASAFSLAMLCKFNDPINKQPHAYRYLHWEAGFIGQIIYLMAESIGKRGTGIGCFFDNGVHQLLGLKDNQYQVLYHFTVGKPGIDNRIETLPPYYHLLKQ